LGDAAYRLNPVFGQGMTVTALGAELLVRQLTQMPGAAPRRACAAFQAQLDRLVAGPWRLSTQAPSSLGARVIGAVLRTAFAAPRAHRRFLETQHLLRCRT
jgi:2-polyprenyl-6-methoxyphenol hydroxylase-like FAD-dependent oxidoreductase